MAWARSCCVGDCRAPRARAAFFGQSARAQARMDVSEKDVREAAKLVKRVVRAESIDEEALRALKQFARRSDPHVQAVFASVWDHLGASNAIERLLALQLCAHLWSRSAAFRHALLEQLVPHFVQLVHGSSDGLPPPRQWAERLRSEGVKTVESWHASHGHLEGYRPLGLALRHMRQQGAAAATSAGRPPVVAGGGALAPASLPDAAATARSPRPPNG